MIEAREPRSMLDWTTVERARVGENEFVLAHHGDEWIVRVDERVLMSNRVHESEVALADEAIDRADDPMSMLVGGLGLGFTLRAALDRLPEDARVTLVELVPELVDWNRRCFPHLNDHALADPRCDVVVGDAFDVISRERGSFDVIVLDVDNGPESLSRAQNQRLYGNSGTRALWNALAPGGVLGVWSANPNAKYASRLERFGFDAEVVHVPAQPGDPTSHVLFFGKKPG